MKSMSYICAYENKYMALISVKLIVTKVYIHIFVEYILIQKMYIKILFWLGLKDENKNFHMYKYLFHTTVYI